MNAEPTKITGTPARPAQPCHHGEECAVCGPVLDDPIKAHECFDCGSPIVDGTCAYCEKARKPAAEAEQLRTAEARRIALAATAIEARAVDAEKHGLRSLAAVLRKRIDKMVGRAAVFEARAAMAEQARKSDATTGGNS